MRDIVDPPALIQPAEVALQVRAQRIRQNDENTAKELKAARDVNFEGDLEDFYAWCLSEFGWSERTVRYRLNPESAATNRSNSLVRSKLSDGGKTFSNATELAPHVNTLPKPPPRSEVAIQASAVGKNLKTISEISTEIRVLADSTLQLCQEQGHTVRLDLSAADLVHTINQAIKSLQTFIAFVSGDSN